MYKKKILALAFLVVSATVVKADQSIQNLQIAASKVRDQLQLSTNIAFAADLLSHEGYIIEDEAVKQGMLSQELVDEYNNALYAVKNNSYAGAAEVLYNEHNKAIDNVHGAIDTLIEATSAVQEVFVVAEMAADADTTPEQQELQDYVNVNDVSLTDEKVDNFNNAVIEVEVFAQQAGAFLAAANNVEITDAIDNYAASSNIAVSSYTAISYTQSIDQYVINFESGYLTLSGYNNDTFVTVEELYGEANYYMNGMP